MKEYLGEVYASYVNRLNVPKEQAEDYLHDAVIQWIEAERAGKLQTPTGHPKGIIISMLRVMSKNIMLNASRRNKNSLEIMDISDHRNPENDIIVAEGVAALKSFIAKQPKARRDIATRLMDTDSMPAIAEATGLSYNTVKAHMRIFKTEAEASLEKLPCLLPDSMLLAPFGDDGDYLTANIAADNGDARLNANRAKRLRTRSASDTKRKNSAIQSGQ